jgi:hypothetical protein
VSLVTSNPASANNKLVRVRLGGLSGTAFLQATHTTNTLFVAQRLIQNRNSQSSQVVGAAGQNNSLAASAASATTGAVDMSSAQSLVITGQLANAAESGTLESWLVEVFYAA